MLSEVTAEEAQQDLETLRSLFKKYHVCIAGNLEETIEKAASNEVHL